MHTKEVIGREATDDAPYPLVILPGLLCDARMFDQRIAAFGALVVDGFYSGADRIEAMATYALARLPGLVALLGHSMGARVALELWRMIAGAGHMAPAENPARFNEIVREWLSWPSRADHRQDATERWKA